MKIRQRYRFVSIQSEFTQRSNEGEYVLPVCCLQLRTTVLSLANRIYWLGNPE